MKKIVAIILASGVGNRFNSEMPKQFVKLAGKRIVEHTIDAFENHPLVDEIYIVVHKDFYNLMEDIIEVGAYGKVKKILCGGETRQKSSSIGCFACEDNVGKVLIHDAVRPFVSMETITNVILALDKFSAVDVAIPSADTIIRVSDEKIIKDIPPRKYLLRGQTPQGFRVPVIKKAHMLYENDAHKSGEAVDDCSLVLKYDLGEIYVLDDLQYNMKITYPLDMHIADKIFQIYKFKIPNIDINFLRNKLDNKVIVVFGGTSGIGLDICKLCEELGGHAYSFSRRTDVDVRDFGSIKKALDNIYSIHNRIDSVICSAGILKMSFIEAAEIPEIINQINVNLVGNILVAKASIPYLKETKGHLIFFTSSSYTRGRRGYTPYSASKAALVNFVQGFSDEVGHYGIKVNAINPERTDTPLRRKNFGDEDKSSLLSSRFVAQTTLKTMASDITGAVIEVRKIDEILEESIPNTFS